MREQILLAVEAPPQFLPHTTRFTDFEFVIAPYYLRFKNYREYYQRQRADDRIVVLDNGVFEDDLVGLEQYIDIAKEIQPQVIAVPDVIRDFPGTQRNMDEFLERFKREPALFDTTELMGIMAGKDLPDCDLCHKWLEEHPDVSWIGLPYVLLPEDIPAHPAFGEDLIEARRLFLVHFFVADPLARLDKPHHLLGLNNPCFLSMYRHYDFIKSVDTGFPVAAAIQYKLMDHDTPKPPRLDYSVPSDSASICCLRYNMIYMRRLCHPHGPWGKAKK